VDCGKLTMGNEMLYFINIASAGVAGKIMYIRETSSFRAGTIAYLYYTLKSLLAYEPQPMKIKYVNEAGESQEMSAKPLNLFVCNGQWSLESSGMQRFNSNALMSR
jgi:diacylglycerol kinase family enzyme